MKTILDDFKKRYGHLPIVEQIQIARNKILYRQSGATTRVVDSLVQTLFTKGEVHIVATDDIPNGTSLQEYIADPNLRDRIFRNLCSSFERRLELCHTKNGVLDFEDLKKTKTKAQFESGEWYNVMTYELLSQKERLQQLFELREYLRSKIEEKKDGLE